VSYPVDNSVAAMTVHVLVECYTVENCHCWFLWD